MYRITYEQGNGYSCNCCRSSYTNHIDLDSKEEVYQWLVNYYADKKIPLCENDDDRDLESIEKEIGVDIKDEFEVSQKDIDHEIANRTRAKEEEEAAEKEKRRLETEKREKATLKTLAAKYPEVLKEA